MALQTQTPGSQSRDGTAVPVTTLSAVPRPKQTAPTIACCLCGRLVCSDSTIEGRCVNCLSVTTDFTEHIARHNEVELCRTCGAWYRNPQWVRVQPESPELLALCIRRIKGLKGLKLVSL